MPVGEIDDIERLKKINAALISRVERSMDQQGNAFSLFQTAIGLENRVRSRTEELRSTLRTLEQSNVALGAAKESAELANLSKTRFLAAASHDVLQPLNAAHLSISALAEIQSSEEGKTLVRQVERSLETMEDLLRTLLDISKLDAGVVKPEITDVSLDQLFSSLESDFRPLARQKGLKLKLRGTDLLVRSDRILLRRILQNVLSNALRYTRAGGALIGARRRVGTVRIDIADTGCGIPDHQREAVFDEFHRGPADDDLAGGGLGLGLAIVRRMAGALGHHVSFSSRVGRGTVFHVDLPIASSSSAHHPDPGPERTRPRGYGLFGTQILLIENDPDVLDGMTSLFHRWQCGVRAATSEAEAMAILDGEAWLPDIIIADQHLDRGDFGNVTIGKIRDRLGKNVPALIVTADPSEALASSVRASGIEMMRKPVKPAQLRALMAHLLA